MRPRPRRRPAAAALGRRALVALALLSGCGAEDGPLPRRTLPIADLLAGARRYRATAELDFGEPATRARLWSGWGADEHGPEGSHVWGLGERSTLFVDVVEPRTRRLVLRGWSHPFGGGPSQQVTLVVNGVEIGRRPIGERPGPVELEVDADAWHPGENRIDLHYARHAGTASAPGRAVAWDRLRIAGGGAGRAGAPELDGDGTLRLPRDSALELTLELPGGTWLAWSALEAPGGARLEVARADEAEAAERDERSDRFGPGAGGRLRLTDEDEPFRLHRLTLRATGEGELRIVGARLHLPAEPGGGDGEPVPPATGPTATGPTAAASSAAGPPARPPNLLVYVVDTLRADHLGCYGYPRPTSPELDRFARGAALYREARAQSSWTRPAMATLLTGLLPSTHQAEDVRDRLSDRIDTLAERLGRAGYRTAMFTANANAAGQFGFRQGFEQFAYLAEHRRARGVHAPSEEVNREVFSWLGGYLEELRSEAPRRPFFLVVHTTDPHDPYTPRSPYRERLAAQVEDRSIGSLSSLRRIGELPAAEAPARAAGLRALYDAEVASNDAAFGALLARLGSTGLSEETVVVFTSDHGEEFYEHGGWLHGRTLYEEQLRVPLVVRLPGAPGRVLPGPVEQIDLVPTLLELAGLPPDLGLPGRSLVAEIRGAGAVDRTARTAFATLDRRGVRAAAAVRAQWKLLFREQSGGALLRPPFELYALSSDPAERRSLVAERPLRRRWLEGQLAVAEARHRATGPRADAEIDRELEERLRALGYLN
jgi:arylsulfatase A-like enzyme